MDRDSGGGSSMQPKDFLALTHGQEWVQFYESFDRLVQDNLARSSELLRRAMSLPEVADREVAQVRTELEGKLAAERDRAHAALTAVLDDLTSSHRQVALVARTVGAVMTDLDRLSQRVTEFARSFEAAPAAQAAPTLAAVPAPPAPPAPYANGTSQSDSAAAATAPAAPESVVEPAPVFEASEEAVADATVAAEPVAAPAAAEQPAESESVAAEAESAGGDDRAEHEPAAEAVAEAKNDGGEPAAVGTDESAAPAAGFQRPHWLSVTRLNTKP